MPNDWTKHSTFGATISAKRLAASAQKQEYEREREETETVLFLQISEMEDWRNSFLPARSLARRSMAGSTSWGLGYASDPPSIFDITLVESDERSRKTHVDFMGSASLVWYHART